MFQTWTDKGILKPKDLKQIQDYIDRTVVPPDVGRIPNKLEAGASGMTADQWKNWTLIYSRYILSTVLPQEHYECCLHQRVQYCVGEQFLYQNCAKQTVSCFCFAKKSKVSTTKIL